ncbi:NYN domain-containing protein [Pseudoalteromonas sp. MMG024]|uniref:NYN domain-containing protein n=1 Tax=Pseudoalteromonas sp. MMG024 TaxID=2909980 RepID=UPI001F45614F|nr:NYN domain-containing protein [Pseudoalteromonas sp. MMG024]MCF6459396.1 NYN domain-containing protein [Pseudoalteromonas sp. MMG024]
METKVYIDGYNFYYGRLKGTNFKWLDYYTLFYSYLLQRNSHGSPKLSAKAIKFFTAPIDERVAMDAHSVSDQHVYHTALNKHLGDKIDIISGYYDVSKNKAKLVDGDKEPRECESVYIWKIEEKQSDVNVAVHAIFDTLMDPTIEQVVFVSNDTDILPAMLKLREYRQLSGRPIVIGLVIPKKDERTANTSLIRAADWHIPNISDFELQSSQLPNRVNKGRKPAFKPNSWYETPEIVSDILGLLKEAYGKMNEVYRWLDSIPKNYPEHLPKLEASPFQEMNTKAGCERVLVHAQALRDYKLGQK